MTTRHLSLALALTAALAHAQDRIVTVDVRAQDAWTRTGIQIPAGTTVILQASGNIEATAPTDNRPLFHRVPPTGRAVLQGNKPQPLMRTLALLGKIGDGPAWEAGAQAEVLAGDPYGAGELQLGINDDYPADNTGTWTVRVTLRGPVTLPAQIGRGMRRDPRAVNIQQDAATSAIEAKASEFVAYFGGPLSPIQPTKDGTGRFRTYQNGSIYWHPNTGAHEIHGGIRDRWNSVGAESSSLGYPVSDEYASPDGQSRISRFQFGSIIYDIPSGTLRVETVR